MRVFGARQLSGRVVAAADRRAAGSHRAFVVFSADGWMIRGRSESGEGEYSGIKEEENWKYHWVCH